MICVTLAVMIGLGELLARLFFERNPIPAPPPPSVIKPYRPNPYIINIRPYIYVHIPGSAYFQDLGTYHNEYTFNAMGFRGPDIPSRPPEGTKRLIVLGDSIVEGHGIPFDRTFSFLLNGKLAEHNWEVLNLGVQGASPIYFAANMERYLSLKPDAVLIIIHENDLFDDDRREHYYFDLPVTEDRAQLSAGGRRLPVLSRSSLYALLDTARQKLFPSSLETIIARNAQEPPVFDARMKEKGVSGTVVPAAHFARRWTMSASYLTYTVDTFRKNKVIPMVAPLCATSLAFTDIRANAAHCANLETSLQQWAGEHQVPFFSLVPTMQRALQDHTLWEVLIRQDYHPTELTHTLLADDLYPFVAKQLTIQD